MKKEEQQRDEEKVLQFQTQPSLLSEPFSQCFQNVLLQIRERIDVVYIEVLAWDDLCCRS